MVPRGFPPHFQDYPFKYHQLIKQQTTIGWDNLFRGRWSQLWGACHRTTLNNRPPDEAISGTQWIVLFGTMFLRQWFKLWDTRNLEWHGRDKEEAAQKRRQFLLLQLKEIYALRHRVLPAHRQLFLESAEEHLESTSALDSLDDWIQTMRPAILSSITKRAEITSYFSRESTG